MPRTRSIWLVKKTFKKQTLATFFSFGSQSRLTISFLTDCETGATVATFRYFQS
jgi:hypothetical protein